MKNGHFENDKHIFCFRYEHNGKQLKVNGVFSLFKVVIVKSLLCTPS